MSDVDSNLSPDGIARRDEILALAQSAARARRSNRAAVQFGIGVICMLTLALAFLRTDRPAQVVRTQPAPSIAPPLPVVDSVWIETDPTIVDRLSIPGQRGQWQRVGDDEFLRELADAGKPAGLAQIGDKTLLLSREPRQQ